MLALKFWEAMNSVRPWILWGLELCEALNSVRLWNLWGHEALSVFLEEAQMTERYVLASAGDDIDIQEFAANGDFLSKHKQ